MFLTNSNTPSFCVCCQMQNSQVKTTETLAHHLSGRCAETADLVRWCEHELVVKMNKESPKWMQQYRHAGADDDTRAATVLAAADAANRYSKHTRKDITRTLNGLIQVIRNTSPLCKKQNVGASIMALEYRDVSYNCGDDWLNVELQGLAARSGDGEAELQAAVPSRSLRSIKLQLQAAQRQLNERTQQQQRRRQQQVGAWQRQDAITRCPVPIRMPAGAVPALVVPVTARTAAVARSKQHADLCHQRWRQYLQQHQIRRELQHAQRPRQVSVSPVRARPRQHRASDPRSPPRADVQVPPRARRTPGRSPPHTRQRRGRDGSSDSRNRRHGGEQRTQQRRKSGATQARTELWRRGDARSSSGGSGVEGGGGEHSGGCVARISRGQRNRARKRHRHQRTAGAATAAAEGEEQVSASADGWTLNPDDEWPALVDL